MSIRSLFAVSVFSVMGAGAALAQPVDVSLGVSTLGATLQAKVDYTDNLKFRGMWAGGLSGSGTENIDGIDYSMSGNLGALGVMADYHVGGSGFFVSGGAMIMNTSLKGSARADGTNAVEINGTSYGAAGDGLDVEVEFANNIAPYLGLGYRQGFGESWSVGAELGAVMVGGLDLTGTAFGVVPQAEVDAELQSAQDDIGSDADVLPFLSFNVGYKF